MVRNDREQIDYVIDFSYVWHADSAGLLRLLVRCIVPAIYREIDISSPRESF